MNHAGFEDRKEMLRCEWYSGYTYLKSHRGKYYQRPHDRPKPGSRERSDD